MGKNYEKYPQTTIIEALQKANGLVSVAAEMIGCERATIMRSVKKHKSVRDVLKSSKEKMLDFAESKLFKLIKEDDRAAIFFFLKCQGKERGYIERSEITGADGRSVIPQTLKVEIIRATKENIKKDG